MNEPLRLSPENRLHSKPIHRIRTQKRVTEPQGVKNQGSSLPENVYFVVTGAPIAKPRQTQRDKWAKRPCVVRYREWADRARNAMEKAIGAEMLETARRITVSAYFPMPDSWSRKKRAEMRGTDKLRTSQNMKSAAMGECAVAGVVTTLPVSESCDLR